MRLMPPPHLLNVLHADNVADSSGIYHLFQCTCVIGITQYVAHGEYYIVLLDGLYNSLAFTGCWRHRFFKHDMITFVREPDSWLGMHLVLRRDNNPVCKLFPLRKIFPACENILFRNIVFHHHLIPIEVPGFGHTDNLKAVRIFCGKPRIR